MGDKVYYKPKLSGLKRNKALKIKNVYFQTEDTLFEVLGVEFTPTWIYEFEGISLGAIESDLSLNRI